MAKRQCYGLETFHGHLSTIFPAGDTAKDDNNHNTVCGIGENDQVFDPLPVKFTKCAVELLRETYTAFLRRVGTEIAESESQSQQSVLRALSSILGGEEETTASLVKEAQLLLARREQRDMEEDEGRNQNVTIGGPDAISSSSQTVTGGKRKRKRRLKAKAITAEMEAEQERLLNVSKEAFESAQQQQNQGEGTARVVFRVQLS